MFAGFSKIKITPPLGTKMFGWGDRDSDHGCDGIHDDLFVRALWVSQDEQEVLILGFDLLFFSRDIADRLRGAIGRRFGLAPKQVLLNTSHTHDGPATGAWAFALFNGLDCLYIDSVEQAIFNACSEAKESTRPVTVAAGETSCDMLVSRRTLDENGNTLWIPNYDAPVYNNIPICLLKDANDSPVCLLFSVSCHPATIYSYLISADYPGTAMSIIDSDMGVECSLFLQGVGGDAMVKSISNKNIFGKKWEDAYEAGKQVAEAIMETVHSGLSPIEPDLCANELEIFLPITPIPDRNWFETLVKSSDSGELLRLWAQRQLELLDRGMALSTSLPVTLHGIRFGKGLRIAGLEGEVVAEHGTLIRDFYGSGVTFPMGYTDGCQVYIPTSKMLDEGGYEVDSYYEYGCPAPLSSGIEDKIIEGLKHLRI